MRHTNSHGKTGSFSAMDGEAASRVHAALRAEAQRHKPDSAAMLARVERAMHADEGPTVIRSRDIGYREHDRRWYGLTPVRVVAAAGAVLVVAGGGWAVAEHTGTQPATTSHLADPSPQGQQTRPTPTAGAGGAVNAHSATPTAPTNTTSPSRSPSASATVSATPADSAPVLQPQQGFLWSGGSVTPGSSSYWSQNEITLKSTKAITTLSVVLRLASTPGIKNDEAWSSATNSDLTITVTPEDGGLVYTFALKPGATLPAGTYEFAGQYTYTSGTRNTAHDTYLATASAGTDQVEVGANFG